MELFKNATSASADYVLLMASGVEKGGTTRFAEDHSVTLSQPVVRKHWSRRLSGDSRMAQSSSRHGINTGPATENYPTSNQGDASLDQSSTSSASTRLRTVDEGDNQEPVLQT
jgi:hypothetical protein